MKTCWRRVEDDNDSSLNIFRGIDSRSLQCLLKESENVFPKQLRAIDKHAEPVFTATILCAAFKCF